MLLELKNKNLSEKIVQDISESEVETMNKFFTQGSGAGIEDHKNMEDHLRLAEFTLLIALRVGAVSLDTFQKIKLRFQSLDRRHEQRIRYDDVSYESDSVVCPYIY